MDHTQKIIVVFLVVAILFSITSMVLSFSLNNFNFAKVNSDSGKPSSNLEITVERDSSMAEIAQPGGSG